MTGRPPVNFKRLKQITFEQAVQFLSELPKPKWEKGEMRFACPACGEDDKKRALAVHPTDGFTCYAARGKGFPKNKCSGNDATALVAHVRGISNYDAGHQLEVHFFGGPEARAPDPPDKAEPDGTGEPLEPLTYLVPEHEVVELLGLSAATLKALGGGYAPKGTMIGRLLIPLRMEDGRLVGYLGIATKADQEPLLRFPDNLEARCVTSAPPAAAPEKPAPDALRKLFRVV